MKKILSLVLFFTIISIASSSFCSGKQPEKLSGYFDAALKRYTESRKAKIAKAKVAPEPAKKAVSDEHPPLRPQKAQTKNKN